MTVARIQSGYFDWGQDKGPMKCCWMLAGVVDYKLCDRQYECDECPFDAAIRDRARSHHPVDQAGNRELLRPLNVQGYELAPMLFYHPRHLWARIEDEGKVRIGLDDFGQRLIGRVYAIELPAPGTVVSPAAACWRIAHHAGESSIISPVSGRVVRVNHRLCKHPSLINRDPYGEGWLLMIRSENLDICLKGLYYGRKVEQWFEREIEKLYRGMSEMLASSLPGVGATLQDGGSPINDFTSLLTADQMRRMIDSFLSVPISNRSASDVAEVRGPDQGR